MNGLLARQLHELVHSLSASLDVAVEATDLQLNRIARATPVASPDERLAEALSPRHLGISATAVALIAVPAYIGGSVDLGVPSTLVIPVRSQGAAPALLLWVTCARGPLSSEQIASVQRIAVATVCALESAGMLAWPTWEDDHMGRAFAAGDLDALDALLGDAIRERKLLHDGSFVCVAMSMPTALDPDDSGATARRRMTMIANRLAEQRQRDRVLIAYSGSVSFALFAPPPRDARPPFADLVATHAADLIFRSRKDGIDPPWLVAASSLVPDRASVAVWQARQALDLAESMGWKHQVIHWETAAHMRGFAAVPTETLERHFISPPLKALLGDASAADLVRTLRAFLHTAGNVKQISEEQFLHRATVYHRIRKLEGRLGVDLFSGAGRLEVHVGLVAATIVEARTSAARFRSDA